MEHDDLSSRKLLVHVEKIIGTWFKKSGLRNKVILATKVAGPGDYTKHIRKNLSFKKEHINEAVNKSLERLNTDYIDLYQLHWPEKSPIPLVKGILNLLLMILGLKILN